MKRIAFYILFVCLIFSYGCKIALSFNQGVIDGKTFSIGEFPNYAPLVQPQLSQNLIDALRSKIVSESSLKFTQSNGDLMYTGSIIDSRITQNAAVSSTEASSNQLTVTVKVKCVFKNHTKEKPLNFEEIFTASQPFETDVNFSAVEDALLKEIVKILVQKIYTSTLPPW